MPKAPSTVLEIQQKLLDFLPGVDLDNPWNPVALIGHADGNSFSLSTDEDVRALFQGTEYNKVMIEAQELFPQGSSKKKIADFSEFLETQVQPQDIWSTSVEPSCATNAASKREQNRAFLQKVGRPPDMAFGRRLDDRWSVCLPLDPAPGNKSCQASSSKAEPQPRRARSLSRPTQHDARTGRQLDKKWAIVQDDKSTTSSQMLDIAGIKKDFEDLEAEAHERRHAMGRLLRPRWRAQQSDIVQPGLGYPAAAKLVASRDLGDPLVVNSMGSLKPDPVGDNHPSSVEYALPSLSGLQEMCLRSDKAFGQKEWMHDLGCVAQRDVPPLIAAIESVSKLQDDMRSRLQEDVTRTATWQISGALQYLADARVLPSGGSNLRPRKTMAESPWLYLEKVGRVMFRLLPCGDAAAAVDCSTIFVWADTPTLMTFTIELGGIECIAPRLWPKDQHHYRIEVPWQYVTSALAAAEATDDCLAVTFKVLQFYDL